MALCIQCGEPANFYEEGSPLRSFCYASCQLIGQNFEGLTNDAVISIWLRMDLVDVTAFCQVNKRFRALCHSERFTGPYFRDRTDILEQLGKFMDRNVTDDFAFWVRKASPYVHGADIFRLASEKHKYLYWKLLYDQLIELKHEPVLEVLTQYLPGFSGEEIMDFLRFVVKHWTLTERSVIHGRFQITTSFMEEVLLRDRKMSDVLIFHEFDSLSLRSSFVHLLENGTNMREILTYIFDHGVWNLSFRRLANVDTFRKNNVWDLWHRFVLRLDPKELIEFVAYLIKKRRPVELLEEVVSLAPLENYGPKFSAALIATYTSALKKDARFTKDLAIALEYLAMRGWSLEKPFVLLPYNKDLLEPFVPFLQKLYDPKSWRMFLYKAFLAKDDVDERFIRFILSQSRYFDWKKMYLDPKQSDAWSYFRKFDPRPVWEYLLNSQLED